MTASGNSYNLPLPSGTRGIALSPDLQHMVYALKTAEGLQTRIMISSIDGSEAFELVAQGAAPRWHENGSISCRYDLYTLDLESAQPQRLTHMKLQRPSALRWAR